MLDKLLVAHCAPTLGGLKTANLFSCPLSCYEELDAMLSEWNKGLNPKGVYLHSLGFRGSRALIYVCRSLMLAEDLQSGGVRELLGEYGYREFDPDSCIERLRERLRDCPVFPHEIGLFLGYPLEDVKGFIENCGQNYKCKGDWKVYCNECDAVKRFMKHRKCREIYTKLYENRVRSVYQLTVAVS